MKAVGPLDHALVVGLDHVETHNLGLGLCVHHHFDGFIQNSRRQVGHQRCVFLSATTFLSKGSLRA